MPLLRPAFIVGLATVASRVLGFVRDVLVAGLLGAGPAADAFLAALRLPNALRRTLGEGGLNAAFVPIYARLRRDGGAAAEERAAGFAAQALGAFALLLLLVCGLCALGSGLLLGALAPGFSQDPAAWALAGGYLRLMLPFVGFASLASMLGALLNAEQRFVAAAVAPALVNGLLIGAFWLIPHVVTGDAAIGGAMAIALSLAGLLQLIVVVLAVRRLRLRLPMTGWLRRPRLSPELQRLVMLGAPALAASAGAQMVVIVASAAASHIPGAVAWLYYADRLFQLPLSFAGVAVGTVLLSEMAAGSGVTGAAPRDGRDPLNAPLEAALALALPAAVALMVLAEPIVRVLFERGAFGAADRLGTAAALAGFAAGLPGGVAAKVLLQPFFLREQARVPLLSCLGAIAVAYLGSSLASSTLASSSGTALPGGPFGVGGIAAAVALALTVQALALGAVLASRGWWRPDRLLLRRALALLAASALMGAIVAALAAWAAPWLQSARAEVRFSALALLCLAGMGIFGLMAALFGGLAPVRAIRRKR